jgi:predicted nucleotidyltransferase component of viral defense system
VNNVASIKDRLKNKSRETGRTLQELFTLYGLERTIYRLSVSHYKGNFVLKGGIFLYALYQGDYPRSTTDIDLLAQRISNAAADMKAVFTEILSQEVDDPLRYDLNTLNVTPITEFKEYHGVNVSVTACLDRTKIPVSIDIGFNDLIYPDKVEMEFPITLEDNSVPRIFAYSLYSSVSEKFEAIVSLGYDNSRFKDYYDLYILATRNDFDGKTLAEAVRETFDHRKTGLTDIAAFETGFAADSLRQSRWNAFTKKKQAMISISLEETIRIIQSFLTPVIAFITSVEDCPGHWLHEQQKWE